MYLGIFIAHEQHGAVNPNDGPLVKLAVKFTSSRQLQTPRKLIFRRLGGPDQTFNDLLLSEIMWQGKYELSAQRLRVWLRDQYYLHLPTLKFDDYLRTRDIDSESNVHRRNNNFNLTVNDKALSVFSFGQHVRSPNFVSN